MDDILKNHSDIQQDNALPSYVRAFLPEVPFEARLMRQSSVTSELQSPNNCMDSCTDKKATSPEFDVTGSPLKCTIYSLWLNDSKTVEKELWSEQESTHCPISLSEARTILCKYLQCPPACHVPLWILCDGQDASKTLLLCSYKKDGWCSRSSVHYIGKCLYSTLKDQVDVANMLSVWNKNVNIEVNCLFNLLGINSFEESLDFSCYGSRTQNFQKMLVDLTWHYPSLKVPSEGVSALLNIELEIGHKCSLIFPLWQQLEAIQKYCEILNASSISTTSTNLAGIFANCNPKNNINARVTQILNLIYKQENLVETLMGAADDCKSGQRKLSSLVKQVLACQHPDSDAADKIWLLLNEIKEVPEISLCLNEVLSKLEELPQRVHAIIRKNILLNTIIAAHLNGNLAVTEVSFKKTLEIMIETGIEKLKQDYCCIFKFFGLNCEIYFKKLTSSKTMSLDAVKHNVNVLSQLHVALDFILGVHQYLEISESYRSVFAQNILNKCLDKVSSLNTLRDNLCISIETPVRTECVLNCLPENFVRLRMINSSKDTKDKNNIIVLITYRPLFPLTVFQTEEDVQIVDDFSVTSKKSIEEQEYYIYKCMYYCDLVG